MKRASIAIGKRKPTDHCRIELSLVRATPQMPKVIMDTKAAERAERLRLIRKRLHKIKTQRQMAAVLGVPYHTYHNWERGLPIPATEAKRIKGATPGISGDWLLWGDEAGLTVDVF